MQTERTLDPQGQVVEMPANPELNGAPYEHADTAEAFLRDRRTSVAELVHFLFEDERRLDQHSSLLEPAQKSSVALLGDLDAMLRRVNVPDSDDPWGLTNV